MSNEISLNMELKEEISRILKNEVAERHSYFQLRYFLIGKEPTIQSKMWQCIKELKIRKEALDSLELEYQEQKDKLELLGIEESLSEIEKFETNSEQELALRDKQKEIKIRRIKRQKQAVISSLNEFINKKKYIEEESRFFLEMFKSLESTEKLKPFDDVDAQKEYWAERLSQKLNLKMLTNGQLDTELIETIVALPDDMKIKQQAIKMLDLRHSQMTKSLEVGLKREETNG
jgi:hypothetical protein